MHGRLLPVDRERFVVRIDGLEADPIPFTFMEPGDDGRYQYVHMGARLYRRGPPQ